MAAVRTLTIIFGDQLNPDSAAFDGFDKERDLIWMAEVAGEATHVPSHKVRVALFLTAMRHYAEDLRKRGYRVEYRMLDALGNTGQIDSELRDAIVLFQPEQIVAVEPGEYRIEEMLKTVAIAASIPLDIRPDRHFFCSRQEFAAWAQGHQQLRMEFFYREMRKKSKILMERGQPEGGQWNYDGENRKSFGKSGPGLLLVSPRSFPPDEITQCVMGLVERFFPNHPGSLKHFDFPVTSQGADEALTDFITHRLPMFGDYQDAMWTDEPYLFHSRLSALMNLKLLNPRKVLMAVEDAYHCGRAPLAATEGYVRQILGWREYIRGVYWLRMPQYLQENALDAHEDLPDLYWTGQTEMNCLKQSVGQTLEYGYAHHIHRLMVTGLFSLLFGVKPIEIHKWYLAIYWDAVEWVELPNVLGMSQYADGGLMASKPYIASGKYIARMSNYCSGCRYKPDKAVGENACPFTLLYWDFLLKHQRKFEKNTRMSMQLRNVTRLKDGQREDIRQQARAFRASLPKGNY